jgi:hypothetical protein
MYVSRKLFQRSTFRGAGEMLRAAVLTVLLTAAAGAQVAKFEFPVTKESVLFITHAPDNKQSSLMKTAWCDGFYLICAAKHCEPLVQAAPR